ncbi:hypothetical protein NQ318_010542 [Aromia moschata]|uniref:Ig-like domain-containing protein n=1 Tax=Aromia moschata TaxID=1265417 RepID=A0AAV8YG43_9CUCU|nr:hypothetical protein NQ318_010542 [Aromia moschata]
MIHASTIESTFSKPEILSKFETIIENNDNYTVFCQGNKPLKWTTPEVAGNKKTWTTIFTKSENPISPNYQYGSRLHIINMTYPFVGFYYCHHEDVDKNDYESTSVYLYVNGELNDKNERTKITFIFFIPDNDHFSILDGELETVVVTQFQEAIIPCRPTSPDVHVTLYLITGEPVHLDTFNDLETLYRYERLYGFFTNDTKEKEKEYMFECLFSKNGVNQTVLILMTVEIPISHLAKPSLRDRSGGHTVVGDTLFLDCEIKTTNSISFHWTTPSGPIDRFRMNTTDQNKTLSGNIFQTLLIYNTTMEDKGKYICNITDAQDHSSYADLEVKIYDENEYFLNISETSNIYSIVASAGEEYVQWSIDVQGHPIPMVTWLNHMNETIPLGNSTKYVAKFSRSTNEASLKIKNIAINDLGYYTILASNKKTEKMLSLFLNVTDSPSVHIESRPFHLINRPSTIKCFAYANPKPEFKWEYKPCQTCNFIPVNATVLKTKSFEFISQVTINASQSGSIKCSASNYKGYDEAISGIFVSDIKNGFDIFGLESTVDLDEEKMVAVVARGETITVTCGASIYNYSGIEWLRNEQTLTEGDRYKISKSYTEFSNKINLEIPQANFSDNGLYVCRVIGQDGEYLYKNISFYISDPIPPRIRQTNMKDELEINIPEKMIILCEASGIPKPTVTWYKNGALFEPSEPKRIKVYSNNEKILFSSTHAGDEGTYKCVIRNKMGVAYKQQTVKFKIENINPELGIDDQAELLPYNKKWEFPIEDLKLDNYIDQVDPKTGKIDYMIGQELFDRSYSVSSDRSNAQSPSLKYAALTFSNSSNQPVLPPPNSMGDYRENTHTGASGATEITTISPDDGHYIDLNDPYLVMNTQRIESGESDYLAMLSPPTFEVLSSPHYVNENVCQEPLEDSGYLSMKPNTVFSPRLEDGQVFDFNISNRKHLNSEDGNGHELLPMLRQPSESDGETPLPTPITPNSFSNPTYHIPPRILEETRDCANNNTDIVKSVDNYVNMPQNKTIVKEKGNPSNNPFVNVNSDKGGHNYVNSNSRDWESVQV